MLVNRKIIFGLIIVTILVNAIGLLEPLLRNDDPVLYANIAKHIALSGDWVDLILGGQPWLDKPHFPFWVAALFFKIFGINSFAYILPGFLFHILGVYYTYRLAKLLFNQDVALIAVLIYVSSLHLIISAIDVRAEAYLLGLIMPACYYWLIYDRSTHLKPLLLASIFTAISMMTKGLFVVITIFSGMVFTWLYTKELRRIISPKWLIAYLLCLIFILPELICLYLQFDLHPQTTVLGRNNLSGISWYFWGSQFGRFFNSGPIVNTHGNPFFFIHTYLWAFLPWSIVFILANYSGIRYFKQQNTINRAKAVYLFAGFWLTFIMFSLTKFQLDHYTNIIMPVAAILCANYLLTTPHARQIAQVQLILSYLLGILNICVALYLFKTTFYSLIILLPLLMFIASHKLNIFTYVEQCVVYPVLFMLGVILLLFVTNQVVYKPYDVGYNLAQIINARPSAPVYDLQTYSLPLEFHLKNKYFHAYNKQDLPSFGKYYIVIKHEDWQTNKYQLDLTSLHPIASFCGNTIDKILPYYANPAKLQAHLQCYEVLEHVIN